MLNKMTDLLFIIGLFLTIIGGLVLGTFFMGPSDLVQGIHVNMFGGGMMALVGISMLLASHFRKVDDTK